MTFVLLKFLIGQLFTCSGRIYSRRVI